MRHHLLFASIFCYFIILSASAASSGAKIEINKITRAVAGGAGGAGGGSQCQGRLVIMVTPPVITVLPTINNMARDADNWE